MTTQTQTPANTMSTLPEAQKGPAEKLLDLVLSASAHLWHNRPGLDVNGTWHPKRGTKKEIARLGKDVAPGLFVPAAEKLYSQLAEIYALNAELMARFASYALTKTEWRDLKVACAALMLVQPHSGQPIADDDGTVAFHDDDWRATGEAMLLFYEKKSTKMLTPKAVLRVAELLESPGIAEMNRIAGFADVNSKKAPLGRWKRAATRWLERREKNLPMLQGLVKAGYKETIKKIARKAGYKPESRRPSSPRAGLEAEAGQAVATAPGRAHGPRAARSASASTACPRRRSASGIAEAEAGLVQGRHGPAAQGHVGLTPAIMVATPADAL